ncbi:hypothetical protein [Mycobacterium sp. AZCC_0083]|uniref:DUF7574 domain-containing protein n=1 Tax=Mycobacterium sp. AZCC_0083 TaxID=2735882 RepID=UPI00160CE22E|nr:hypothetical protein [Mycobacterium sp. AZCC_0083]MBB5167122.1 hypothetical protein [Mycobacterium sp. AZCC_0083]
MSAETYERPYWLSYHDGLEHLEFVFEFEKSEPCYSFDTLVVLYDTKRKAYRIGEDSGCSCPSPFEDFRSDGDWGQPLSTADAIAYIRGLTGYEWQSGVSSYLIDGKRACVDAIKAHSKEWDVR